MIDLNKKYRTKDGCEVRIYAIDGTETTSVHGAIKGENGWFITTWRADGISSFPDYDLVEVTPRIKRDVWINVYKNYTSSHFAKEFADFHHRVEMLPDALGDRLACIKVEIDCEVGEGL